MTLTTHAMVGAAAAQMFPTHPVLAFSAGFVSHFVIDAIPHWDYKLLSGKEDNNDHLNDDMALNFNFLIDLIRIGTDFFIGTVLSLFIFTRIFNDSVFIVLLGVLGSILPDPLQFVYWKTKSSFLRPLQIFHIKIQDGPGLRNNPFMGIALQIALVVFTTLLVFTFK